MEKPLQCKYQETREALLDTIADFRSGRDLSGLDTFLNIIEDIDDIIQTSIYFYELRIVKILLPVAHALHDAVCNEDTIGITDILEYSLLPIIENTLKEVTEA